jgi:glycosyltransferase involved in cell wall biosynthesis
MNILLPSDVFPPKSGGAGWSAHALACALIARGHHATAVVPRSGKRGLVREEVLGVPTLRFGYTAPPIPFVKNYFRHEQLWHPLADALVREALSAEPGSTHQIIHAQHVQVTPASIIAGRRLRASVVVTVRDHWPWDYFATGLHGDQVPYGRQTWASLATDLVAREGPLRGASALIALPYVVRHMRRRQAFLGQADAVIAVSHYIAKRLEGIVAPERIHVIPNMVDVGAVEHTVALPPQSIHGTYLLFVGKLERNKGAHLLIDVFRALRANQQSVANDQHVLVVAGDGSLRPELERELAMLGVQTVFLDWADHDEVLRLMAHCALLLFPSAWGEPLSRVWLEAAACGAPILAMPTGGITDVITDGVNGVLAATPGQFAQRMVQLLANNAQRQKLSAAARATARERFSTERVIARVEGLYEALCF